MDIVLILAGTLLVLLALADVFVTVLYARAGTGLLTPHVYRATWMLFKRVGARIGRRRDAFLSFAGPTMMVLTVSVWFSVLLLGFALIAWPALGTSLQTGDSRTPLDFWSAVYYAGYSLTTLGTGDIVPRTGTYRTLMVVQAALGFSVITLTLTYFMSVYSAVVRRNTLAQALHHLSGGTGSAVDMLIHLEPRGDSQQLQSQLTTLAFRVLDLLESHHSYPVLHYFRMRDERYAMARMAVLVLQPVTLVKSALGPDHRHLASSAAVRMLWGSGTDLLHQAGDSFLKDDARRDTRDHDRRQFQLALARLREAGIQLAADTAGAEREYLELRDQWADLGRSFAELMGYHWDAIEVDGQAPHGRQRAATDSTGS
ncbi:MAG: potassium channel family protein [Pseudomonadota bacterium]|nr:potassium channel family protein [Pseudomonadota bacterium]